MINKIRSIKNLVEELLVKFPQTRDNDNLLIFKICGVQNPEINDKKYLLHDFAREFINGIKFTDAETIRRTRQKLQEKHSNLRGRSYGNRHCISAQVRKEINNPSLFDD